MGPNVAGVIGSAVAAGILLGFLGYPRIFRSLQTFFFGLVPDGIHFGQGHFF